MKTIMKTVIITAALLVMTSSAHAAANRSDWWWLQFSDGESTMRVPNHPHPKADLPVGDVYIQHACGETPVRIPHLLYKGDDGLNKPDRTDFRFGSQDLLPVNVAPVPGETAAEQVWIPSDREAAALLEDQLRSGRDTTLWVYFVGGKSKQRRSVMFRLGGSAEALKAIERSEACASK